MTEAKKAMRREKQKLYRSLKGQLGRTAMGMRSRSAAIDAGAKTLMARAMRSIRQQASAMESK